MPPSVKVRTSSPRIVGLDPPPPPPGAAVWAADVEGEAEEEEAGGEEVRPCRATSDGWREWPTEDRALLLLLGDMAVAYASCVLTRSRG